MNEENQKNAEVISNVLDQEFKIQEKNHVKILDICCGVFDKTGTNYDEKGEIYEPIVVEKLAEIGYYVTGLDFRENKIIKQVQDGMENELRVDNQLVAAIKDRHIVDDQNINYDYNTSIKYTHCSDIDILQDSWSGKLPKDWNVLIFLRSWDTPEILLHYQKVLDVDDLNLLSLEIAKIYLPTFAELLEPNGLFFTTDICNYALCDDDFEILLYKNQVKQLMSKNNFEFIDSLHGLSWYRKKILD